MFMNGMMSFEMYYLMLMFLIVNLNSRCVFVLRDNAQKYQVILVTTLCGKTSVIFLERWAYHLVPN